MSKGRKVAEMAVAVHGCWEKKKGLQREEANKGVLILLNEGGKLCVP